MWVFSSNWVISFFFNFSMVLEIGMNLCVTEPDILEKLFLPQQLGKQSQNRVFLNVEKQLVNNFHLICSIMKMYIIFCI